MLMKLVQKACAKAASYRRSLYAWIDYRRYASSLASFRGIVKNLPAQNKGSLLIVSGRGMNITWAHMWAIISLSVRTLGYRGLVLTTRHQENLNRYYRLLGLELIFFEDIAKTTAADLPPELTKNVEVATTFETVKSLFYEEIPIGQIALSTYSRYHGTGSFDLNDPKVLESIRAWIPQVYLAGNIAKTIYDKYDVQYLFFTEVFMEEYGAFYYVALSRDLNIVRFAGTVRDDAYILQHLTRSNDRRHHASLCPASWERIKTEPLSHEMEAGLEQNFLDRYGDRWHRSKRNYPNTRIMPVEEAREMLNIREGRKAAVIYSHILYDTIFFFGTDLFDDYAKWLIETVRAACQNPAVDWFIKVHPSNLWRGELTSLLGGKYEEEIVLHKALGRLPEYVRLVYPDNPINPYTWLQLSDYGITVRGTAGLEMAALGKPVITAGTGRYENNGFTIDPKNKDAYLAIIKNIQDVAPLTSHQKALARRYAYAIFVQKPFTFKCMKPGLRTGARGVRASDDLVYTGTEFQTEGRSLPPDLKKISDWVVDKNNHDLLSDRTGHE